MAFQRWYRKTLTSRRFLATITKGSSSDYAGYNRKRCNTIKEILSTEETYVGNLGTLLNNYIRPLREQGILSLGEIEGIFCNIADIYEVNCLFLSEVRQAVESWPAQTEISYPFKHIVTMMPLYSLYMRRYEHSGKVLCGCLLAKPELGEFLSHQPIKDLSHFLIMPIQRLPRYQMLLNQLISVTPKEHRDRQQLRAALNQVVEVVAAINELKKQEEDMASVMKILAGFESLTPMPLNMPDRRVLFSGFVIPVSTKKIPPIHKPGSTRWFLFNDLFVSASPAGDGVFVANSFFIFKFFQIQRVWDPPNSFCITMFSPYAVSVVLPGTVEQSADLEKWLALSPPLPLPLPDLPNMRVSSFLLGELHIRLPTISGLPPSIASSKVYWEIIKGRKKYVKSPEAVSEASGVAQWPDFQATLCISGSSGISSKALSATRARLHHRLHPLFRHTRINFLIKSGPGHVVAAFDFCVQFLTETKHTLIQIPLTAASTPLQPGASAQIWLSFESSVEK